SRARQATNECRRRGISKGLCMPDPCECSCLTEYLRMSPRHQRAIELAFPGLFEIPVEPGYHATLFVVVVHMSSVGINDALKVVGLVVKLVEPGQYRLEFTHPCGWRPCIAVACKGEKRTWRKQRHYAFRIEMLQNARNKIIDTMCTQRPDRDQVFVSGKAGHTDDRLDPVVYGTQPPGTCAPHAHPLSTDPARVDLRSREQVIKSNLLIAQHHSPESTPEP